MKIWDSVNIYYFFCQNFFQNSDFSGQDYRRGNQKNIFLQVLVLKEGQIVDADPNLEDLTDPNETSQAESQDLSTENQR